MDRATRASGLRLALFATAAYVAIGVITPFLAGDGTSPARLTTWRLVAWILSLAVFAAHVTAARLREQRSPAASAVQVALAVALAATVLAAAGPVRTYWGKPNSARMILLSLVLWPVMTGLPAFVAAFVAGRIIRRGPESADELPSSAS